jgi:uncharacterized OB-fold protein
MKQHKGLTEDEMRAPTGKLDGYCYGCGLMRFHNQKSCPRCGSRRKTNVAPEGKNLMPQITISCPPIPLHTNLKWD